MLETGRCRQNDIIFQITWVSEEISLEGKKGANINMGKALSWNSIIYNNIHNVFGRAVCKINEALILEDHAIHVHINSVLRVGR